MTINGVTLLEKHGGKSGSFVAGKWTPFCPVAQYSTAGLFNLLRVYSWTACAAFSPMHLMGE
jgi:hypothetical protein